MKKLILFLVLILSISITSIAQQSVKSGLTVGTNSTGIVNISNAELKTIDGAKSNIQAQADSIKTALTGKVALADSVEGYTAAEVDSIATLKQSVLTGIKFFAPYGSFNGTFVTTASNSDGVTANTVRATKFYLPFKMIVDSIGCYITTASVGQTVNHGIYNNTGTKLIDSGAIDCSDIGYKKAAITPTILEAGFYWCAWSASNNIVRGTGWANNTRAGIEADLQIHGLSPNSTSAGVMPNTLGTLTKSTHNSMFTILIDK